MPKPGPAPAKVGTVTPIHRVELVDALRGFALFGVVVSNMAIMLGAGTAGGEPSPLDSSVERVLAYIITGKFLALFSLLFGVSFGLYLRRLSATGRSAAVTFLRRMLALFLIGAANHAVSGTDVLMTYAVLGAILLLFRNASDTVLLLAAILSLGLPELWSTIAEWTGYQPPRPLVSRAERTRLAMEGTYLELLRIRALMLPRFWHQLVSQSSIYFTLFLLGLWTARRRLLEAPAENRRLLWSILAGALVLTAIGYVAQDLLRPQLRGGGRLIGAAFGLAWEGATFTQAIAYGSAFGLLWLAGGKARSALAFLAPAGRMALTNYLFVSIIGVFVILAGMYGRTGWAQAFSLGAALWLAQILWSRWWLTRFRTGPFEWIWRKLSFTG